MRAGTGLDRSGVIRDFPLVPLQVTSVMNVVLELCWEIVNKK